VPLSAVDDTLAATEDTPATISPLANDKGVAGHVAQPIAITGRPKHGTATVGPNNVVTYVPNANFYGADDFNYRVTSVDGDSSTGKVDITVAPVSDGAPIASDDSASVDYEQGTTIDVTSNDTSTDGIRTVAIASGPSNGGTATMSGDKVDYKPAAGFSGTETFTYTITDHDGETSTATVSVTVAPAPPPPPPPPPPPVDPPVEPPFFP
jgi:hypothetical protein